MSPITQKPGLYPDMSDVIYHASEGVNNSLLKQMYLSGAHAKHYLTAPREKSTPAMFLGSLQHQAILEPGKMRDWEVKPQDMSFSTKEGKAWREERLGKRIISHEDNEAVKGMTEAVWANPEASALLKLAGKRECSAFVKDEASGLMLKARFDFLPDVEALIVDIKTCESARLFDWERSCVKFRYHCQAAWYVSLEMALNKTEIPRSFFFIAVEKAAPYCVQVYQIGDASLDKGREENKRLLYELSQCYATGKWPAYFEGVKQFDVPRWALEDKPDQSETVYQLETA